ncbi:DNA repair protein RAD4 isoform X2 [Mercurialis annua]|nr:DNA repair protein RAD4 isoform X2 [Mercurialis annua]
MKISEVPKLSANALSPIVSWFHNNFHVRSSCGEKRSFQSALAFALESRQGTPEEIAALSVALFRALKLTTRFVSILDAASIKPDADKCESSTQDTSRVHRGLFSTSTLMVDRTKEVSTSPIKSFSCNEKNNARGTSVKVSRTRKDCSLSSNKSNCKGPLAVTEIKNQTTDSELCSSSKSQDSKRKSDIEFEMQLQMALSATAIENPQSSMRSDLGNSTNDLSNISSPLKRVKIVGNEDSPSHGISTAVGSKKIGSPLYWAEVYCCGENLTGKWVHVDAVNAIIDGEQKVEAAAAACKTSLRYAVAFAGHGAKDVTRRYCMKWYKIAPQRVDSTWWDAVMAPLRELESGATGGLVNMEKHHIDASDGHESVKASRVSNVSIQDHFPVGTNLSVKSGLLEGPEASKRKIGAESSGRNTPVASRASLEDMELETRALTEPLPTNQQAYKNHQLYTIERWLTKYQILHPRGPVLGFCSGHPVYPRACVQTLKTEQRWLREGLQVKNNENPAKVLKQSVKLKKLNFPEDDDYGDTDSKGDIELYGKWQVEPLKLPRAVNGIVPRNERGQVDVWSEKCLPPGTVHLRLPRIFHVAKRLEIDYAPAMVGFEFRNGRSVPVFEGIVVCTEFKDAILEAYDEEIEIREAEERKRNEAQAISRWYQLLSSIITRQRLNKCYGNSPPLEEMSSSIQGRNTKPEVHADNEPKRQSPGHHKNGRHEPVSDFPSVALTGDHEHVYLAEDQSFDEESSVTTKRCHCGFSIQVEEL